MSPSDIACYASSIANRGTNVARTCSGSLNRCDADFPDFDGVCASFDNCQQGPNPNQGPAVFGQTILAPNRTTFEWQHPVDALWVRGPLQQVDSYAVDLVGAASGTSFEDLTSPAVGERFYYLVRLDGDCAAPSWQTTLGGESGRDASLP
jgi:hypothetical protein